MQYDDHFKYLVGGYYGIKTMDNYSSKLYILKDIEKYIRRYVELSNPEYNYREVAEDIEKNETLKTKLQDSLILLNEINGPMELVILIKQKIKEIRFNEKL